ncbi:fungal hydrophobin-domain-containing protein [Rhodocollybia butyracea]|uniref:Hydrophobin n=1 Tax=Rhodocollybia butyracea TaxID=206335 RepID=A0A9P5P2Q3_9AGAR|nr:fungal hydrophobin-domain-containing protein [Rhodocollybia butyracea]
MQFKLALVSAALATLVAGKCSTGPIQCCKSTQTAVEAYNAPKTRGSLGGLVDIVLQDVAGLVGLTCSPVDVGGGGICTSQTVCCKNNAEGGLISIGCAPVTL